MARRIMGGGIMAWWIILFAIIREGIIG